MFEIILTSDKDTIIVVTNILFVILLYLGKITYWDFKPFLRGSANVFVSKYFTQSTTYF